jgi:hypothetical protein
MRGRQVGSSESNYDPENTVNTKLSTALMQHLINLHEATGLRGRFGGLDPSRMHLQVPLGGGHLSFFALRDGEAIQVVPNDVSSADAATVTETVLSALGLEMEEASVSSPIGMPGLLVHGPWASEVVAKTIGPFDLS